MSQAYVSYYEAYDANGNAVFGGNGYVIAQGVQLTKDELEGHTNFVLQEAKRVVPASKSIIFKGLYKL